MSPTQSVNPSVAVRLRLPPSSALVRPSPSVRVPHPPLVLLGVVDGLIPEGVVVVGGRVDEEDVHGGAGLTVALSLFWEVSHCANLTVA